MASGSFNLTRTGSTSSYVSFVCNWSSSSNGTAANSSTVNVSVIASKSSSSSSNTWGSHSTSATVDGSSKSSSGSFTLTPGGSVTLLSQSYTVSHNSDGSKSTTISVSVGGDVMWGNGSATITLDTIPRQANITAAPNFTDEENPTITYNNPAGSAVSSLQACISLTGAKDDIAYRDISKTGTSYTFNLTDAERAILRNATPNSNTLSVTFFVRTVISGTTFYSTLAKTMTIVNGNPTLTATVEDGNAVTVALTGDANTLVKYYSNATANASYSASKGASISSYKVVSNNKTLSTIPAIFNAVESNTFVFTVTDSRGNSTTQTITKNFIEYIKLTCNLTTTNPTTSGGMTVKISGNYFNGSFGTTANTLAVAYRYKENDGEYSDWKAATATISGSTYTSSTSLTGLNYKSTYTFQARAIDQINTSGVTTAQKKVRSTPVFDWGDEDFSFNVPVTFNNPVTFNEGINGGNKVLWSGSKNMLGYQTITLSEAISAQPHGIILVFSGYSSGALDSSFNTFVVSKQQVALFPDCGHTFLLGINAGFSKIGAKYLKFTDTKISGDATNGTTGTNNGITYTNNYFVLRYVIGF